tara:strand:+ start:12 stop:179 length:168 start_codon:yes stop_codon:yes gene_type:complete
MKEYTSTITLIISGNNITAQNKKDYIEKLKDNFKDDYNLDIYDEEIKDIEEVKPV